MNKYLEILSVKLSGKYNKEEKKLLKKIRKMKVGDDMKLHDYEIICIDPQFYILINPNTGIFEKHYNELIEWIINGGEL